MRIARFMVSKPGMFGNRLVDLPEGLSVIYGRNGSGKSLVSRALVETIWGCPRGGEVLKNQAWSDLYLELDAESRDASYRYTRNSDKLYQITRRSGGAETALYHGLPCDDAAGTVSDRVLEGLGSGDADRALYEIYLRVGCADYMAACFIPSPTDAMQNGAPRYENLKPLFLDDASRFYALYRQIVDHFGTEDMDKKVHNPLMNEILRHEMLIKDADKKIQILDMQQSKGGKLARERSILDEDLASSERTTRDLEHRKELLEKSLADMEQLTLLESELRSCAGELGEQETRRLQIEQLEFEIRSRFPQFRDFSDTKRQNLKKLQETYREIRDVHVALDKFHMDRSGRAWRTHLYAGVTVFSALTLAYLVLRGNFVALPAGVRGYLTAVLLGVPLAFIGYLYARFMLAFRRSSLDGLWQRKSSIEGRLVVILRENEIVLEDHRLESIYEILLQYFEEYGDYTEKQLDLFKLREGLRDDAWRAERQGHAAGLESRRAGAKADLHESLRFAGVPDPAAASEDAISELLAVTERELAAETGRRDALIRQRTQLEEESVVSGDFSAERGAASAEKERLQHKHRKLCAHGDAMRYILGLFVEVIAKREDERLHALVDSTLDKFNHITGNQYITAVDRDQVRRLITSGVEPEGLSAPLVYILALSVKLGLSDMMVESGLALPVIADDPFVFMDDMRAEKLKSILRHAARTRQVIVFTQNSHHLDPDRRIEL
ncbi:MAG: hypothetical protein EPN93_09265 [Spirochaetes bacterium]|nr:MAG: hypothetical protein EPN93_09265 [Spirochaetota bacterium]